MGSAQKKPNALWAIVVIVVIILVILLAMGKTPSSMFTGGAETLLPAGKDDHTHAVDLGSCGCEISSEDHGHRHIVENTSDVGVLAPADHTHDIASYIVDR